MLSKVSFVVDSRLRVPWFDPGQADSVYRKVLADNPVANARKTKTRGHLYCVYCIVVEGTLNYFFLEYVLKNFMPLLGSD